MHLFCYLFYQYLLGHLKCWQPASSGAALFQNLCQQNICNATTETASCVNFTYVTVCKNQPCLHLVAKHLLKVFKLTALACARPLLLIRTAWA